MQFNDFVLRDAIKRDNDGRIQFRPYGLFGRAYVIASDEQLRRLRRVTLTFLYVSFLLMVSATSSGSVFARSEFLTAYEGAYSCALSSNVTATMGRAMKPAETTPPADAGPSSERLARSMEETRRQAAEAAANSKRPAPLARLEIARHDASWQLTLRFTQVPAELSLRDLAIKIADTSSTAPSADLGAGKDSAGIVTAMATDGTLSLYVNEPVASDSPRHFQVHLRSVDRNIELIVWTIDTQGRRGHGRNCLMDKQ